MNTVSFDACKPGFVGVIVNGHRMADIGWKPSVEFCAALDRQIRNAEAHATDPAVAVMHETGVRYGGVELTIRQELGRILVLLGGRLLLDANTTPAEGGGESIARAIWRAWLGATKQAEESVPATAEKVARDAAILHRSGAPVGLSDNPLIRKEAQSIARHDRDLRRFMKDKRASVTTNGVASDEVLGAPVIGHDIRTPAQRIKAHIAQLPPALREAALSIVKGA